MYGPLTLFGGYPEVLIRASILPITFIKRLYRYCICTVQSQGCRIFRTKLTNLSRIDSSSASQAESICPLCLSLPTSRKFFRQIFGRLLLIYRSFGNRDSAHFRSFRVTLSTGLYCIYKIVDWPINKRLILLIWLKFLLIITNIVINEDSTLVR